MLMIAEEGLENNCGYLLFSKKDGQTSFQKFDTRNPLPNCLGAPLALTSQNEIVFAANPALLAELAEQYPLFSSLDKNKLREGAGYVILKCKIR